MPRNLSHKETAKAAKGRRAYALERNELRQPSVPRVSASSPTAMAVKVNQDADLIEQFLRQKSGANK